MATRIWMVKTLCGVEVSTGSPDDWKAHCAAAGTRSPRVSADGARQAIERCEPKTAPAGKLGSVPNRREVIHCARW